MCISKCSNFDRFCSVVVKQSFPGSKNTKHYFSDNFKMVAITDALFHSNGKHHHRDSSKG